MNRRARIAALVCVFVVIFGSAGTSRTNGHGQEPDFAVTSFGAKGDGKTDDTKAIAAASRAVSQHGGVLVFPNGTYIFNPAEAKILLGPITTLRGPGTVKVKANAGKYQYIIGASDPRLPLDNIVLDGLTVDQNVEENDARIVNSDQASIQAVFLSWNIRILVVRNCTFQASGVNTIVANPDHESGTFENNTFIFHRRPEQQPFDNSAIYFRGPKGIALGNNCRAALNAEAVTCIEMHDGDIQAADNVTENYQILANLADVQSAAIRKNHGTGLERGVLIWATAGHVSHNVLIADNDLSINNVERQTSQSTAGIATYYGQDVTGAFDGITISKNHVNFQPESHPRFVQYPRSNWGISTQAFGSVKNVIIADNTIENAPVRGIKIGQVKLGQQDPLQSDIVIERNIILNAGYNSDESVAPYRAAIAAEGRMENVTIRYNTIDESAVADGVYAIWFAAGERSSYRNIRYYGQRIVSPKRLREAIVPEILRHDR